MNSNYITKKIALCALAATMAGTFSPAAAFGSQDVVAVGETSAVNANSSTSDIAFGSPVGKSSTLWSEVPSISAALDGLHGGGETVSSLASFQALYQAVSTYGSQQLALYANGEPVMLEDGYCYSIDNEQLNAAKAALADADRAVKANTTTLYVDQSKAIINVVNQALNSAVVAREATQLKLLWDGEALEQVADESSKTVKLAKGAKATKKEQRLTIISGLSKAGASATFSKVSGSNKISVSKTGRATLKKGTKKGTYKAKVKVSYNCKTSKEIVVSFFVK